MKPVNSSPQFGTSKVTDFRSAYLLELSILERFIAHPVTNEKSRVNLGIARQTSSLRIVGEGRIVPLEMR